MQMEVDILVTTYNRKEFLKKTLESLFEKTKLDYRLFIIDDCSTDGTQEYLMSLQHVNIKAIHLLKERMGVVPCFNIMWNIIRFYDRFFEEVPYLCYMQDDCLVVKENWLAVLIDLYERLKTRYDIGFISGYDAKEHPVLFKETYNGYEIMLKKSQTATNLIAEKRFWKSLNDEDGEVPRYNPDGSVRGMPNNGRGSNIDLYWTGCMRGSKYVHRASAPNSSYKQNKLVLVSPMIQHLGANSEYSTWRT